MTAASERVRRWRQANPEKAREQERRRRERRRAETRVEGYRWYAREMYGLSPRQLDRLVLISEGRCAICREETPDLHVDHEHTSGVVRGLLCGRCNRGLGLFLDSPTRLRAAAEYLGVAR